MNVKTLCLLPLLLIVVTPAIAAKCTLKDGGDWLAQYNACPSSAVAAHNAVLQLYFAGKADKARQLLTNARRAHPDFGPLKELAQEMTSWSKDPYALIGELTDRRMQAWVVQLPPPEPFYGALPEREDMPPLPELVKNEFETTAMFRERVQRAQDQRERKREQIEADYQRAVERYNDKVRSYNERLARDKVERPLKIAAMQRRIMGESIAQVMGQPGLKNLTYNADEQTFYGRLVSSHGNFDQPVRFEAPLSVAPWIKHNAGSITPDVQFAIENNRLAVKDIRITFESNEYVASLTSQSYAAPVMTATLDDSRIETAYTQLNTMQPAAATKSGGEDVFFSTALSLEADPELARLKQQQAELARKQVEARKQQALASERESLKQQIAKQQQALALLGGTSAASSYKGLKMLVDWSFRQSHQNNSDTVMVIIGNRNYQKGVPVVYYAHNDAQAMKTFAKQGLDLPPENIIYEEDATKGTMEGIFKSTLPSLVKQGKRNVIVYFSGHGIAADSDAEILPVDARPNTAAVTGYSRNELMKQIAASGVSNAVVMLDACYTGTNKDGDPLINGKPVFKAPKKAWVPANATLISAASGNQIAWMNDQKGHSLLTYYLLKGLQGEADKDHNGSIDTAELGSYLGTQVNRAALRLHEQPQQPEVIGKRRTVIAF